MQSQLFLNGVTANKNGNCVIVYISRASSLIRFLGASCPASITPNNDCVSSVTFSPTPGKSAIAALAVWNRERSPSDWTHAFLLEITWKDANTPWINLDTPWIPLAPPCGRIGQASEWGVTVQIGGVTYSSCPADANCQSARLRFVPDGNLLCRYLACDATAEDVKAAAKDYEEEQAWPAKYAELQQKFAEANGQIAQLQGELGRKIHKLKVTNDMDVRRIAALQMTISQMTNQACNASFGNRAKSLRTIISFGQLAPM